MDGVTLYNADCLEVLPTLESASVGCVITDPPYPCIKRSYGTWTEAEWFAMMRRVVPECMRIVKPTGSAVFILQPNSERVGRMRTWLWEFMAWVGKEWGIVQDVWWWNSAKLPEAHSIQGRLMRPSVKACVWVGPSDCYRNQDLCLWEPNWERLRSAAADRFGRKSLPSGQGVDRKKCAEATMRRGGSTPFNLLPIPNANSSSSAGSHGHGAGTPALLADWWLRFICPPAGTVLDPFIGSGTVALEAVKQGKQAIGIERVPEYCAIAEKRIAAAKREAVPA